MERGLYQELSRYYPLGNRAKWVRQDLLMNGKHDMPFNRLTTSRLPGLFPVRMDLGNLPPLPEPLNESPP